MALHTFGSNANNSLVALRYNDGAATLDSDIGNFNNSLAGDRFVATAAQVPGTTGPQGIIVTGNTTVGGTSVAAVTAIAGGPPAAIQPGMTVLGAAIPATGASVVSYSAGTLVLSAGATALLTGTYLLIIPQDPLAEFGRNKLLHIPRRGVLKVRPGDVIARDNTGWPILVSGGSVGYPGTQWTFT